MNATAAPFRVAVGGGCAMLGVPVLQDNYVWLLHRPASGDVPGGAGNETGGETVVVDPAVCEPVLAAADAMGWSITQIWNTHWHPDHVGGNAELQAAVAARGGHCVITGPAAEQARITTLNRLVADGDRVAVGDLVGDVLFVGAHTAGHIAYHVPDAGIAFVGDTMFAMGCGRLFEGTPDDMHAALARLMALPDATQVFCAHEYTLSNARWAVGVEPDNAALRDRLAAVEIARAAGQPTVPTTIALERATNVFVRADSVAELARRRAAKDAA